MSNAALLTSSYTKCPNRMTMLLFYISIDLRWADEDREGAVINNNKIHPASWLLMQLAPFRQE